MIFYMLDTNNLLKELKRKCFITINPPIQILIYTNETHLKCPIRCLL